MSRTRKGKKFPGADLNSRRAAKSKILGSTLNPFSKRITHHAERRDGKRIIETERKENEE